MAINPNVRRHLWIVTYINCSSDDSNISNDEVLPKQISLVDFQIRPN